MGSCRAFLSTRRDNPFVTAAIASIPMLWLKETGASVGVKIVVGHLEYKGLLGGRTGTEETVRPKIWQSLEDQFKAEGIRAVLLDQGEKANAKQGINHLVILNYSEEPARGEQYTPLGETVQILGDILSKSVSQITKYSVIKLDTGTTLYSDVSSLLSSSGVANTPQLLPRLRGERSDVVTFVLTMGDKNLLDPKQRQAAEQQLKVLKWK
jgi:hypothetical protein